MKNHSKPETTKRHKLLTHFSLLAVQQLSVQTISRQLLLHDLYLNYISLI